MNPKSKTCFGKNGDPVSEYYSEDEAQQAADHANQKSDQDFIPYLCNQCDYWHLSPSSRHTPGKPCPCCKGRNGKNKIAYDSKESANQRAMLRYEEEDITLEVYPCRYGYGWHLSKG